MPVHHAQHIELQSSNSTDYDHHKDRVERFRQTQQWEEMIFHCRAAIAIAPADWDVQVALGDALLRMGRWREVVDVYELILRHQPAASLYRKLAIATAQLGQISESDDYYAQSLAISHQQTEFDNDFIAQRQAGDFLFRQNKFEEAKTIYQKAVELEPEDSWVRINLGRSLHQLEQSASAIKTLQKAVEVDNQNLAAYYHLATILLEKDKYDVAETICLQALEIDAENSLICQLLKEIEKGKNAQREKETSSIARTIHEEGSTEVSIETDSFQYHYRLGHQLFAESRWEEAAIAYEKAISLNAKFYLAHYALGSTLARLERWAEAVAAYQKTLALKPNLHHIADMLSRAIAQQQQKQPIEIRQALEAISTQARDATLHVELADAFYRYSYINDAISHYRTALDLTYADSKTADITKQKLDIAIARRERLERAFYTPTVIPADYAAWVLESAPSLEELSLAPAKIACLKHKPTISILVPIYNPPEPVLREMIQSVLDQIYPYWELCLADDCSPSPHVRAVLEEYAQIDSRIKPVFRQQNGHISAASNSALAVATGEYVGLLDHDDELAPHALYEVVALINRHPEADMIYSDEDKRLITGERSQPYFKPDWSPDTFLSRMYICHFGTYRRQIFEEIGGFRLGLEGSQDYDLVLRFTEKTQNIFHIPKVLYHWRVIESSVTSGAEAKPYAYEAAVRALTEALERRGEPGRIEMNQQVPGVYIPRYKIKEYQKVSIIIPTRNLGAILDVCLTSIFKKTTYPNYEVVLLDNGSDEPESINIIQDWQQKEPERFKHVRYDVPFNYSRINNYAASQASGEYFLFLNNDTEVLSPDWLEGMVEQAQRASIGAVGAKLYYDDDTLQHGGVVLGIGDAAGHSHRHFPRDSYGYVGQLIAVNNYSAVTAACLMCRKEVFESVGGFEEALSVAFNDVELCIRIQAAGYRNVWLPHVELYHYESKSRGYEDTPEKMQRLQREASILKERWGEIIKHDPCYSPNLTLSREDYSIREVPVGQVIDVEQYADKQDALLAGCLDFPQLGSCTAIANVSGWVLGQNAAAQHVEVVCQGKIVATALVSQSRKDVGSLFPTAYDADSCGFQTQVEVYKLPSVAKLFVYAIVEEKHSLIGRFTVQRNEKGDVRPEGVLDEFEMANVRLEEIQLPDLRTQVTKALKSDISSSDGFEAMVSCQVVETLHETLLAGHIDSPQPGHYTNLISITGWVFGKTNKVRQLHIMKPDGSVFWTVDISERRPDVYAAHGHSKQAEKSGFSTTIDIQQLPLPTSLSLRVVADDGTQAEFAQMEIAPLA